VDLYTTVTLCVIALYIPVAIFRIIRFCISYVKRGEWGTIENAIMFAILNAGLDEGPSPKLKHFFTETHPVAILMDGLVFALFAMLVALLAAEPAVGGILVAVGLFIQAICGKGGVHCQTQRR
jgi:hypothetical protein